MAFTPRALLPEIFVFQVSQVHFAKEMLLVEQEIVIFVASLIAVGAIVAVAHLLGFSRGFAITSEDEVRKAIALAPKPFVPDIIALDPSGQAAIARDGAGNAAIAIVHGNKLVVRILGPTARIDCNDGRLLVTAPELGTRPFCLHLGEAAADWATPRHSAS